MKKLLFYLLFFLFSGAAVFAQETSCSQVLKKAQATFEQGRIYEIEKMIKPCMEEGFTKDEMIAAWKLLSLTYLYSNEKEKSENAMQQFLKLDPEYEINEALDPAEFINLYNRYRTTPIYILGIKGGGNITQINVLNTYSLAAFEPGSEKYTGSYEDKPGFQFGLFAQRPISKRFTIAGSLNFLRQSYLFKYDKLFDYESLDFKEDFSCISLPLSLNLKFGNNKKLIPAIYLGCIPAFRAKSTSKVSRIDLLAGKRTEVSNETINTKNLRKNVSFMAMGGVELKIKNVIGRGYLLFDFRYSYSLNNIVKKENRFSDNNLLYNYMYVDNDFKLTSFQFSMGYGIPIYKPILKKVKSK